MKSKNEFLALLCGLYITVLLAVLPLYTGEGYWRLGETKYLLFFNVTVICLPLWLVVGAGEKLGEMYIRRKLRRKVAAAGEPGAISAGKGRRRFSRMDCAVAAYGICAAISAMLSDYGAPLSFDGAVDGFFATLPWRGYEGWYMGAVSQLFFVGIYFFVSRRYDGSRFPLYLGELALGAVTALGLLQRLGIDPLGLLAGYNSGDWEYGHMLSTLGNINWLCGFYSVSLAFSMEHFLREERKGLLILLYVNNTAAFLLLFIQGSSGGLLITAACVCVCLWMGRDRPPALRRILAVVAGTFFLMPVWERLLLLAGDRAGVARDGNLLWITVWYGWLIGAAVCVAILVVAVILPADIVRRSVSALVPAGILLGIIFGAMMIYEKGFDDGFASGRGFLWRISLESFGQAEIKDKLFGVGPDCYAEAVFSEHAADAEVWRETYWEGAVFTNAHSEPLSQLINVGVVGLLAYLALFVTGLFRYRRVPLGLLALAMYGVHSLVSFQQVLSTPLLFLTLGICESVQTRGSSFKERRGIIS